MTSGCACIAEGGTIGDDPPLIEHHNRIGDAITIFISCSTSSTVTLLSRIRRTRRIMFSVSEGLRPAAGSSIKRTCGAAASAMETPSRRCSP